MFEADASPLIISDGIPKSQCLCCFSEFGLPSGIVVFDSSSSSSKNDVSESISMRKSGGPKPDDMSLRLAKVRIPSMALFVS